MAAKRAGVRTTRYSWHLTMARVDYRLGNFDACITRLLQLDEKDDVVNLYIGFAFYRMNMPGLAICHLEMIESPESLSPDQRYNLYSNLAYLNYDQGRYSMTMDNVEKALSLHISKDMSFIHVKSLVALGRYVKARDMAIALISSRDSSLKESVSLVTRRHPDSDLKFALLRLLSEPGFYVRTSLIRTLRAHEDSDLKMELMILLAGKQTRHFAELLDLAGLCELRLGNHGNAVDLLTGSLELDPLRSTPISCEALLILETTTLTRPKRISLNTNCRRQLYRAFSGETSACSRENSASSGKEPKPWPRRWNTTTMISIRWRNPVINS